MANTISAHVVLVLCAILAFIATCNVPYCEKKLAASQMNVHRSVYVYMYSYSLREKLPAAQYQLLTRNYTSII